MVSISLSKSFSKFFIASLFAALFFTLTKQTFASTTAELLPTSDGTYLQWNTKSGASHFAMVDESSCDANTTFNRETTVGGRDSYGVSLSSIPNGATITQIDITPCASKNTSGGTNTTFNVFYRLNGADSADAGAYALTTTTPSGLSTTSYTGLSTSKNGSSALEIGGVFTAGNRGVKLSRISTVITYILPPSVTTNAASSISATTATLNSLVNPNGISTTANYRYGTSNIGCSSLPNVTSSTSVGSGTSNVSNPQGIASLSAGTNYYFCATATNADGTTYGSVSSFTTLTSAPLAPSNLIVTPGSSTTAELQWQDNSNNESNFRIERSLDGSTGWSQVGSVSANTVFYIDSNLTQFQSYYYRVYAVNSGGGSSYSNTYFINTDIPNNPSNLTLTTATCGGSAVSQSLTWQDNSYNETGFDIEEAIDGINYTPLASVGANVNFYNFTASECNYRVRAINSFGNSDWRYVDIIQ